jgi:hypothetical protein
MKHAGNGAGRYGFEKTGECADWRTVEDPGGAGSGLCEVGAPQVRISEVLARTWHANKSYAKFERMKTENLVAFHAM